jgi:hypothetical protein
MNYSFYSLIDDHQITIPLIQRDFAQGRPSADEIRTGFLGKLRKVLTADSNDKKNNRIHLDFIYGYIEGRNKFIPLDGQQRLTTLFLLHWYIAGKEKYLSDPDTQRRLSSFTYQTRESSRQFCKKLVSHAPLLSDESALSNDIRDAAWFHLSWNNDPTIDAMLNMLDAIHLYFFNTDELWKRLTIENRINFDFINIKSEDFKLTDELYIKMNSRGKPLTKFENFKAQFTDLLNNKEFENEKLKLDGAEVSLKDYFAFRIDGDWINLFWDYHTRKTTDTAMINFLTSTSELLFYIDNPKENEFTFDLTTLARIYGKVHNVLFLIEAFDLLCKMRPLPIFFEQLFYRKKPVITEKVRLFGEDSTDLFFKTISGESFNIKTRILFFAVLTFGKHCGILDLDKFRHFLRIVRNITNRLRQPSATKTEYAPNLRLSSFGDYVKFINAFAKEISKSPSESVHDVFLSGDWTGFPKDNFEDEKIKTKLILESPSKKQNIFLLEDNKQIQGITDNFNLSADDIAPLVNAFFEIWNKDVKNSLVIRAMLAVSGDYAIKTHDSGIYYFGDTDAWNKLFTNYEKDNQELFAEGFNKFLQTYILIDADSPEKKLTDIISRHTSIERDWIYYFLKYPAITANYNDYYNLFTWNDDNTFDLKRLGSAGVNPLSAYHMNPYVLTVFKKLKAQESHFALNPGRYRDYIGRLEIVGIANMYCEADCWELTDIQPDMISPDIVEQYGLVKNNDSLILKETAAYDRIEIAVNFCRDLVSTGNNQ